MTTSLPLSIPLDPASPDGPCVTVSDGYAVLGEEQGRCLLELRQVPEVAAWLAAGDWVVADRAGDSLVAARLPTPDDRRRFSRRFHAHTRPRPGLAEVLALLDSALRQLGRAEAGWSDALDDVNLPAGLPEAALLEDLLHGATHELGSTLGFYLQDIRGLMMRVDVRRKYPLFDAAEFDEIVRRGWSTGLVRELQVRHVEVPLADLSAQIKGMCVEWGGLPKLAAAGRLAGG